MDIIFRFYGCHETHHIADAPRVPRLGEHVIIGTLGDSGIVRRICTSYLDGHHVVVYITLESD